jgi:hypothetical protein
LLPFAVLTACAGLLLAFVFGQTAIWVGLGIAIGVPIVALASQAAARRPR